MHLGNFTKKMNSKNTCLVTTSFEKTWGEDCPILFLGEWCKPDSKKGRWENLNYLTVQSYCQNKEAKDKVYREARALEEELFPYFSHVLNEYHGTSHDQRFWRILIGHWFRRFINVVINRYNEVEYCFNHHKPAYTNLVNYKLSDLISNNSYDAIWKFNDPIFNNILYGKIIKFLEKDIRIYYVNIDRDINNNLEKISGSKLKKLTKIFLLNLNKLIPSGKYFIINSYLPRYYEAYLNISLLNFPKYKTSLPAGSDALIDDKCRGRLGVDLGIDLNQPLKALVVKLFLELIPKCFLEGYSDLVAESKKMSWPSKPKVIFTSNNFDADDLFKVWAAHQIEFGAIYIIGQHGNNYGTHRYLNPSVDEIVADKFLTWGWSGELPSQVPALMLKNPMGIRGDYSPDGSILLIQGWEGHKIGLWDNIAEYKLCLNDQKVFYEKLSNILQKKLVIRLHSDYLRSSSNDLFFWKSINCQALIDNGNKSIAKLIASSSLVVHAYDSTGLIECLSANIPTLAFWQGGLDHLRENAIPYYELLIYVGIVHLSPQSAANKINELNGSIESWWQNPEVQGARRKFCEKFARSSNHPVKELRMLLK